MFHKLNKCLNITPMANAFEGIRIIKPINIHLFYEKIVVRNHKKKNKKIKTNSKKR